ncbi:hypothetical protein [Leuconostoc citreum]
MMDKLKQNKIWLTVIVFGVVIVIILLMMLNQQNQNSPAAQESSYSSSVKASSSSEVDQEKVNEKAYAKKASKMKGHVLGISEPLYTKWSRDDFRRWAKEYSALSDSDKHKASSNFGTTQTISNDEIDIRPLSNYADAVNKDDFESISYFETVKEFNKKHPAINPDDIK